MRCMTKFRSDAVLALAALGSLALGILVYALDRSPEGVYFLPAAWSLVSNGDRWFGSLGGQLPEFAHVYAFGLLTAAVLASSRRLALLSCAVWWVQQGVPHYFLLLLRHRFQEWRISRGR